MKTLVAIVLALGVGFAAAWFIVSSKKNARLELLKVQPPAAVASSSAPVEKIVMVPAPATPAPVVESPQEILEELLNLKLGDGGSRNSGLRLVVFKLETLKQRGAAAVPAIRAFMGRNVDVNYSQQDVASSDTGQAVAGGTAVGNGLNRVSIGVLPSVLGRGAVARRARNLQTLQADWVVPPSLRLGLVGVLKQIGGMESEQVLAEMLNRTARGVEIAYLTVALEGIAPGKYKNTAVTVARELLLNPPAINDPDNLDQLSRSYLYGVLEFYNDTSFAANAQQMLVGADGRLDLDAMDYLTTVLKEQSVSAFYAAYQNPALTNQSDRMLIRSDVLNYVGQNPQANALLAGTLDDPDLDARMKAVLLLGLAGGESDVPTAAAKITLFTSLLNKYANDPVLSKALAAAINNLQNPDQPVQLQEIIGVRRNGINGTGGP